MQQLYRPFPAIHVQLYVSSRLGNTFIKECSKPIDAHAVLLVNHLLAFMQITLQYIHPCMVQGPHQLSNELDEHDRSALMHIQGLLRAEHQEEVFYSVCDVQAIWGGAPEHKGNLDPGRQPSARCSDRPQLHVIAGTAVHEFQWHWHRHCRTGRLNTHCVSESTACPFA